MAKNTISDLRDHLFETLERLKDEESPMDIARAAAVADVAQAIINSAKVEIDLLKVVQGAEPASRKFFGMLEAADESRELPAKFRQLS